MEDFPRGCFVNLRTKAGLAYAVGGGVGSDWDHPGLTILEIGTKTETTIEAIKGLWEQVDLLKKDPPTEMEMKRAKDAILNSFIFNFDTPPRFCASRRPTSSTATRATSSSNIAPGLRRSPRQTCCAWPTSTFTRKI